MLDNITKLDYVKQLLVFGFSVVPIKKEEKIPPFKHNLLKERPSFDDLENWFGYNDYDIAVAGGKVSGNLVCLDFDEKYQQGIYEDWYSTLNNKIKHFLKSCYHTETRNNGRHIRFRTATSKPTQKCAVLSNGNTVIETKNEGGYALIPPTSGYVEISGSLLDLPLADEDLYVEILKSFIPFDYSKNNKSDEDTKEYILNKNIHLLPSEWCEQNMSFREMLTSVGGVELGKDKWRRPDKKDNGISATTNYGGIPMFYCFSHNWTPFSANKPYSKLQLYAEINHRGDVKEAIKYLSTTYPDFRDKCSNKEIPKDKDPLTIIKWSELKKIDFGNQGWWIESLIPKDAFVTLAGVSGEGKTWLAYSMANSIVSGENFLGQEKFKTICGNVLYLDAENGNRIIQKRGKQLGLNDKLSFINLADFSLNEESAVNELADVIAKEKINVVFLDTFRAIAGGIKEEKADEIRAFFNRFKSLRDRGVSFVFLDHHRKPSGFDNSNPRKELLFGSQDIMQ
jgi:hypothetical protein